jgi:hypothetical protein
MCDRRPSDAGLTGTASLDGAMHRRAAAWSLFASAGAGCLLLGWWPALRPTSRFDHLPSRADEMCWAAAQVTADDDVGASWRVAAHTVHADAVRITADMRPDQAPPTVYLLDYGDDWGRLELQRFLPELYQLHRRVLADGFQPVGHFKSVVALRREPADPLPATPFVATVPAEVASSLPTPLTDDLAALGWSLESSNTGNNGEVVATLFVRAEKTPPLDYGIRLGLLHSQLPDVWAAGTLLRPAGSFAAFSSDWPDGAIVREVAHMTWYLPVPPRRDELQLIIELTDLRTARVVAEVTLR